ncbi:MAG: hypothetical protein Q4Q07_05925 [Tissierellia bacterium]|nr:hypothetical protein [Tissierellia bacterium]
MKKFFTFLMILAFLIGCSPGENNNLDSENQFSKYTIQESEVKNGAGTEIIGTRGYIETSIKDIEEVNMKDLKDFYENHIKDREYSWFTIFLDNEYSLVFTGGNDSTIDYSIPDKEGASTDAKGVLVITDNLEEPYKYEEF